MTMKTTGNKLVTVRIILAFLSAICVVLNGRWNQIGEALHSARFYNAMTLSFTVAYLILSVVHISNRVLDQRFAWKPNPDKPAWKQGAFYVRSLLQFFFGLVIPAVIDILVFAIYFEAIGREFWTSGFLHIDFPIAVILIVILNVIYIVFKVTHEQPSTVTHDEEKMPPEEHILSIEHNSIHVNLQLTRDVLCFIKDGRYVNVLSTHGSTYIHKEPLNLLEERYISDNFVRINRAVIVNMGCIKGHKASQRRRHLDLIFKPIYLDYIDGLDPAIFVVTRDRASHFKAIYNKNLNKTIQPEEADLQPI